MSNLENKNNVEEILKGFAEDNKLKLFLEKYKIAKLSEIIYKKYYQKDDHRCVMIADTIEENFSHRTRILIDLRFGPPTVNQVYDALYDFGKDCDIKVVLYAYDNNDVDKGIPVADEYLVASLIGELQNSNVPIVLFFIDRDTLIAQYVDAYQNWYVVNRLRACRIPTTQRFMQDTFWSVYFDSFNSTFYEPWNAFKGIVNETINCNYIIYISENFHGEIKLFWDEKGVRYEVKQISESDEYMKKALDVIMPDLKTKYGEDSVEFENVVGRLPRLYIKYSDKPFNWLFKATPKEISEFAEEMYHDAWGLRWLFEETIEKLYEKVPA